MTDSDKAQFRELLLITASLTAMPNGKTVDGIAPALFEGLRQYDYGVVKTALAQHCRSCKFFPSLSDIVGLIEGDDAEKALKCWTLVTRAIENIGHWHSVRFPHPAIHAAIEDMGGWVWLATHFSYDNADFLRRSFERYFTTALRHPASVKSARNYLPGIDDSKRNAEFGRQIEILDALTGQPVESLTALEAPKKGNQSFAAEIAAGKNLKGVL